MYEREKYEAKIFDAHRSGFINDIQPFLKIKMRIHDFSLPAIRIYKDREWPDRVETTYNFSDKDKESLRKIDEVIESIKHSYQKSYEKASKYFQYFPANKP